MPIEMSDYHIGETKIGSLLDQLTFSQIRTWSGSFHSEGFIPNFSLSARKYRSRLLVHGRCRVSDQRWRGFNRSARSGSFSLMHTGLLMVVVKNFRAGPPIL
jgi:hypothetical protein